ncbi:MAG TPA: TIGR02281 family clan AA aspartic protease [Devosiaceae bacterium]
MLFIGVAIVIAVGLALAVANDAGSLVGLTQAQTAQIIPLVAILILIAGGLFARRRSFGELISNAIMWLAIFGIAVVGYTYRYELGGIADRVIAEVQPGAVAVNSTNGSVTIARSFGGAFHVNATIDGTPVRLIFDTGASAVVLTAEDARAAGIDTSSLRFTVPVQTANGMSRAAVVRLDSIKIGDITRGGIRAFVVEDGSLHTSLLGMSFLETLSSYTVSRNALEMRD